MSARPLLQVDNVTKSFGGVTAVKDLSFSVSEGEILGLIGPNGAGKTTAFNMIAGVYKPTSGAIFFDGRRISGLKPHRVTKVGISRTFQIVKPFARMSVIENVAVGGLFGRKNKLSVGSALQEAREILGYISLDKKASQPAGSLTLGEQRRLELGRALAAKPKLLMLDEVMAGLNQTEISATLELLRKIKTERGLSLLVIEHVIKAMIQLCDRITVMDYGEKIAEGIPSEIVKDPVVITAYMGENPPQGSEETDSISKEKPQLS